MFSFLTKTALKAVIKTSENYSGFDAFIAEVRIPDLPVLVKRKSALTGKINSMILPVSMADLSAWLQAEQPATKDAFPQLTAVQREFVATGITADEWYRYAAKRTGKREQKK